ncbi:MAG: YggT family protein [Candidatus Limiplasma sp.]|nr:YggT family protein [Candidatus Limiplasma sp.]
MLVGLLNLVFTILGWALVLVQWALVIYVILSWVLPQNKYTQLLGKYAQIVLAPVRKQMERFFPKLNSMGMDLSPVVLWLLIFVARWLLGLLQRILL